MFSLWPSRLIPIVLVAAVFRPGSLIYTDIEEIIPFSANVDPVIIVATARMYISETNSSGFLDSVSIPDDATTISVKKSEVGIEVKKERAKIFI